MAFKLSLTIESSNAAFAEAQDAALEAARLLGAAARWVKTLDLESGHDESRPLMDTNGNRCGMASLEWTSDEDEDEAEEPEEVICVCQACGWEGDEDELEPVRKLTERVSPGEPMPAGQCPECGSLCRETPKAKGGA